MSMQESGQAEAARQRLLEEMRRRQRVAKLTTKEFAGRMGFHPSYPSHVYSGRHRPTRDLVVQADRVLNAGHELVRLYDDYEVARDGQRSGAPVPETVIEADELINEEEFAEQRFDGSTYTITIERHLWNRTDQPVVFYPIKIAADVDTHAELSVDQLELSAACGGKPMDWKVDTDWADLKEFKLLFRHGSEKFPLQPGARATIRYSYRVPAHAWGNWFQRRIQMRTERLQVRLVFPLEHAPSQVWHEEHSFEFGVLEGARIDKRTDATSVTYTWESVAPRRHARYRLQWTNPDPDARLVLSNGADTANR